MQDRIRPFIESPVINGVPPSRATGYLRNRFTQFRKNNSDFDEYLKEVQKVILNRELKYCEVILQFLNQELLTNQYTPTRSLLGIFIKLYNYDFSAKQTVDYIEKCYAKYQYLLNDKLLLDDEYIAYTKRSWWDGSTRDFLDISLTPKEDPEDYDEHYFIDISLCCLETSDDVDNACDTKIEIKCSRDIYEDAMMLFAYNQGNEFFNKVYRFAIKELLKKKVFRNPIKIDYGHTIVTQYIFEKPWVFNMGRKTYR